MLGYTEKFLMDTINTINKIEHRRIEETINLIKITKENEGRIFFIGVGGSAANASHAVNDFRKIAGIECYCPTDNVSEITARTNDDGWENIFSKWLEGSRLKKKDLIFILSVGGGNLEKNISVNLVEAIKYAKKVGANIAGIVSRDGGYTLKNSNACILIPVMDEKTVTPQSESLQSLLLHMIVSNPEIAKNIAKWEGTK